MEEKPEEKLGPDDVEVRVSTVNRGGVTLLLYKNARVDEKYLDKRYGRFGWQRSHQLIGGRLYCTVSVKDPETGEWVSKQDVGTESQTEPEKGQASDSFKRACFNWDIGRELYTAPQMFIKKEHLFHYTYDEEAKKGRDYDTFKCLDIQYEGDEISEVTIGVLEYGKLKGTEKFKNPGIKKKPAEKAEEDSPASEDPQVIEPDEADIPGPDAPFTKEEVILLGNCRGEKYGYAVTADRKRFMNFLKWTTEDPSRKYDTPAQQAQFNRFVNLGRRLAAEGKLK